VGKVTGGSKFKSKIKFKTKGAQTALRYLSVKSVCYWVQLVIL